MVGSTRVEEPLPHADPGARERVEERRLAGVGVAGERHGGHGRGLATGSHHVAVAPNADEPAAQGGDPVARQAAVGLDLRLARTPGPDAAVHAARAEALEVGPEAPHAREVVLELGELDLELALGRVRVVGEDVEDDRRAVDDRHVERRLEVALLARRELVVGGDQVRAGALDLRAQLVELAATEVAVRVGFGPDLDQLAGGRDSGRAEELLELGERIGPVGGRPRGDADRERALARAKVAHPASRPAISVIRAPFSASAFTPKQCKGGLAGSPGVG